MTISSNRPPVTFAVVAFNQEPFIRETIRGAFAQSYQPLEIILSDDGSSDRTFEIMQEMAAEYDGPHRVVVNRNSPNLGLIPHLDRVMEMTSGEFVVINAGDDVSVPERTDRLVQVWLQSGRRAKLVHSAARRVDTCGRSLDFLRPPSELIKTPTPATIICGHRAVIGATAAWDMTLFRAFGPLGQGLSTEDTILPFRAAVSGGILYVDEDLVQWRVGGVSTRASEASARNYLYGRAHRGRKWIAEIDRHILARFSGMSYPDKARIEAVCRDRAPRLEFAVDLAEASHARRLAMLPRALGLAVRHHSSEPVKDWLRFTFDRLYISYADRQIRRQQAGPAQDPASGTPKI